MLSIIAKVTLGSTEGANKYCELAAGLVAPTRAEKGCLIYGMSRDLVDDKVVWIAEEWESEEDLMAHLKAPHIQEFLVATADLDVLSLEDRLYEVASVGNVVMPE